MKDQGEITEIPQLMVLRLCIQDELPEVAVKYKVFRIIGEVTI